MPNRALDLEDLATPIVTSSSRDFGFWPRSCQNHRRRKYCRFFDNPYCCSPCRSPRCASASPYRRRTKDCQTVSKRGLKSGRVVCDTFTSVCYPRNMASFCNYRNPRRPYSCSPKRCYRSCTPPILCENGICRGVCKCRPGTSSCRLRSPCAPRSPCDPCSPAGDVLCGGDTSTNFDDAMNAIGPLTSRYEPHMCPWEADVTVSGTIKAHCTSTADEISERLAGPFKALGRRYTTDAEYNFEARDCRSQKLSLGQLNDGGTLDFSKNNRPTITDNLDYRVKRIMNSPRQSRQSRPSYQKTPRDGHIHWDKHVNEDDFYETEKRYSPRKRHDKHRDEEDKRYITFREFGPNSQTYDGFQIMRNRRSSANNSKLESSFKESQHPSMSDTEREDNIYRPTKGRSRRGRRKESQYPSMSDTEREDSSYRPSKRRSSRDWRKECQYPSMSDTEREDSSYQPTKRRSSRDWRKLHDNVTDDDDDDGEKERYHYRNRYKSPKKYGGFEIRGNNLSHGEDYDYHRYSSGGNERDKERRYQDMSYEGDARWARRDPERKGGENRGSIRFWPR